VKVEVRSIDDYEEDFFKHYYEDNWRKQDELRNKDSNGSLPVAISSDDIQVNAKNGIRGPDKQHREGASDK